MVILWRRAPRDSLLAKYAIPFFAVPSGVLFLLAFGLEFNLSEPLKLISVLTTGSITTSLIFKTWRPRPQLSEVTAQLEAAKESEAKAQLETKIVKSATEQERVVRMEASLQSSASQVRTILAEVNRGRH